MKVRYLIVTTVIAMMMVSCGVDNTKIDPKAVNKLYNEKLAELCMDKVYTTIDTGYYELNDAEARYKLQQLAHAGVIEYNVERFAWFNKCTDIKYTVIKKIDYYCKDNGDYIDRKDVYGKGEEISYDLEEHYMVDVRISSKYKSMLVDALPEPNIEDLDMAAPLYDYEAFPEDNLQNNEAWPEMVAPKIPDPPVERKDIKCKEKKETPKAQKNTVQRKEVPHVEKKPRCVSIDMATTNRYKEAKNAEKHGNVLILAYEITAVKSRNLQVFNKEDHSLAARCEVIVKSKNVTPQGHILMNDIIDGIPAKVDVTLTYYVDKGWVIDANETQETKQVKNKKGKIENVTTTVCEFAKPEIDPKNVVREYPDEPEDMI
ncbi:MAG: hypothetical protein K5660_01920 [Paludibacteraceae bacterium]|nr:hypothetical protein [Paludibacteraceae bacterium]